MFRRIAALVLLAAPAGAIAQTETTGDWAVGAMPNGCMMQAVSPEGTMLSVWGIAGDDKLGFLLQNKGWNALRDGASYQLKLDFLGVRSLPVEATARSEIDSDGPGYYFTVQPGGAGGDRFMDAFSTAQGMRISRDGESVDTMPLAGGKSAMGALARCLAERWSEAGAGASEPEPAAEAGAVPI